MNAQLVPITPISRLDYGLNKGIARCDKDNFRPISILPTVSKAVIEHFVHLQLYGHSTQNNLLFDKQFGFRQRRSTANYSLSVYR